MKKDIQTFKTLHSTITFKLKVVFLLMYIYFSHLVQNFQTNHVTINLLIINLKTIKMFNRNEMHFLKKTEFPKSMSGNT